MSEMRPRNATDRQIGSD